MRRRARSLFWLVAAVTCAATTIIPMSVEELTRGAEEVVVGQALDSWSAWNPQHTLIYTYTRFQVARSLKGRSPQTLVVKQLGGSAEGYTQKVSGVRHFQAGEEALLFLRRSGADDGTRVVVGLMQGNFRIQRTADGRAWASNGIVGAQSTGGGRSFAGSPRPLSEIESQIQRALTP